MPVNNKSLNLKVSYLRKPLTGHRVITGSQSQSLVCGDVSTVGSELLEGRALSAMFAAVMSPAVPTMTSTL